MPHKPYDFLTAHHYRLMTLCTLMATVGCFDFMLFWYHAETIAAAFFDNSTNAYQQYWYLAALFASGYLSRPLGGWLFGLYGDTRGRKKAVAVSLFIVSLFTLILAFLPTYAQLGSMATVLFILARLGQSMAFGSQLPALWVYLCENLPIKAIGLGCGLVMTGSIAGMLLVLLVFDMIEGAFTQGQLSEFGWRIPFVLGGVFGMLLLCFSRFLSESPLFLQHKTTLATATPFFSKNRWTGFLTVGSLSWFVASILTVCVVLIVDLINLTFFVDKMLLNVAFVVGLVFLMLGCVFFGFLTDRINAGKVVVIGCLLFIMATTGLYYDLYRNGKMILLSFALVGFFGGVIGAVPAVMVRFCPIRSRLSTVAIGYNISYSIIALVMPLLLGFLTYHVKFAPALYLALMALMTLFFGLYLYYSPRHEDELARLE